MIPRVLLAFFGTALLLLAQEIDQPAPATVLERLFLVHETDEAFAASIAAARKAGVPDQNILEAKFIHFIDRTDEANIAALAPDLAALEPTFDPSISQAFALRTDFLAVSQFAQALAAYRANDDSDFKKHITEAFWHSPDQSSIFGDYVKRLKLARAMEGITVPFDISLPALSGNQNTEPVTLQSLFDEQTSTIVLYFWSPWALDADVTLSEFAALATDLKELAIPCAAILLRPDADTVADAIGIRQESAKDAPITWLSDRKDGQSYAQLLQISPIPSYVVIKRDGSVLFNGTSTDPAFHKRLKGH